MEVVDNYLAGLCDWTANKIPNSITDHRIGQLMLLLSVMTRQCNGHRPRLDPWPGEISRCHATHLENLPRPDAAFLRIDKLESIDLMNGSAGVSGDRRRLPALEAKLWRERQATSILMPKQRKHD